MSEHFLVGKHFYRLVDDEKDGGCFGQHGKIIAVDTNFALIQFGDWGEDHLPIDKPLSCGRRLLPILALCDEFCCLYDTFEEVLAYEIEITSSDRKDEFASKWEAKMNEHSSE